MCHCHGGVGDAAEPQDRAHRATAEPAERIAPVHGRRGRGWLQPAGGSWRLCVAATLSLSLSVLHGTGAQSVFYDRPESLQISSYSDTAGGTPLGKLCSAQTPPHGFVFPVKCQQTGLDGTNVDPTLPVLCEAISFSVVTNQTAGMLPDGTPQQSCMRSRHCTDVRPSHRNDVCTAKRRLV